MKLGRAVAVAGAVIVLLPALSGCGKPRAVQPGAPGTPPPPTVQAPPAQPAASARPVYTMDLSTTPKLYQVRAISGLQASGGTLQLKTDTGDGNFGLYQKPLPQRLQPPLWLKIEMSNRVPGTFAQIYWDTGHGYSEKEATTWKLPGDGQMHDYTIPIAAGAPVRDFRFDPSAQPDTVKIKRFEILSGA